MTMLDIFGVLLSIFFLIGIFFNVVYVITVFFAEIPGFQAKIAEGFSKIEEPYN